MTLLLKFFDLKSTLCCKDFDSEIILLQNAISALVTIIIQYFNTYFVLFMWEYY